MLCWLVLLEGQNCQDRFEEVAKSPRFNFIGNVKVGHDIPLKVMKRHYDALLFAYGASHDRALGVPGEDLNGIVSARAFVGWYNGLPEYDGLNPDLQSDDTAHVIGNGNVALDVARILLSDLDRLRTTDITEQTIEALSKSKIKRIQIYGRRGPMQVSCELRTTVSQSVFSLGCRLRSRSKKFASCSLFQMLASLQ